MLIFIFIYNINKIKDYDIQIRNFRSESSGIYKLYCWVGLGLECCNYSTDRVRYSIYDIIPGRHNQIFF